MTPSNPSSPPGRPGRLPDADSTFTGPSTVAAALGPCIAVRILAHPNPARAGEWAVLFDQGTTSGVAAVHRFAPDFRTADGKACGPLASTRISRKRLTVTRRGEEIELALEPGSPEAVVNGAPLECARTYSSAKLAEGLVVLLGKYCALWIGWLDPFERPADLPNMIGESRAMWKLRREVHRIAEMEEPVLLRGETGVGKELVAAAIHARSRRATEKYVAVNLAGIPPSTAVAELFGYQRGSFTGAHETRAGYFAQASGGTLFLDEIGDIAMDVQAALLRAVQERVVQPLGTNRPRGIDVRLLAATDSDLERAIKADRFREPLMRRFELTLNVPPLRARRDDVGMLFNHFLREKLYELGDSRHFTAPDGAEPWIPASFVADLALYDWPGNVRELSNVAKLFLLENRDRDRARTTDDLRRLVQPRAPSRPSGSFVTPKTRGAASYTDDELRVALHDARYSWPQTSQNLGVSKSYLYRRLEQIPGVIVASKLSMAAIEAALQKHRNDVAEAAYALHVSERALALRMTSLKRGATGETIQPPGEVAE